MRTMRTVLFGIAILAAGCGGKNKDTGTVGVGEGAQGGETVSTIEGQTYDQPEMIGHTEGGYGFCLMGDAGLCAEFPPDQTAQGEPVCGNSGGSWMTGGCPAEGVLGTCTNPVRGGGARLWLYSPRYATAEDARLDMCNDTDDVFEPGIH